ncbi:MAG: PEGA domain-containing protein [Desulfobacterales bacterium]|nr:PEGA domain-containing protein [Desulfobacterales bacterium]
MKKLIGLLTILSLGLLIISCDSTEDPVSTTDAKGNIYITSQPSDAEIWIDGTNTTLVTPDTVEGVTEGLRTVTLRLQDYYDTTFTISVTGDETSVVGPIVLVSDIIIALYGPVKIYETIGTSVNQPSGLDLSSGNAWGVSSDSSGLVDIYYSSTGFLVQSAHLYSGLVRETDFFVASASNLFDGSDSPLSNTGTWTTNIADTVTNYVFLYDHDGNYSKLKIVNMGGGTPNNPAWVEVQWYYNKTMLDNRF